MALVDPAVLRRPVLQLAGVGAVAVVANGVVGAFVDSRNVRAVAGGVFGLAATLAGLALALLTMGRYVRVSPRMFRRIAFSSAVLCGLIIFTGAAVRLTGSGLGCPDWPTCKQGDVIPRSGGHAQIEFGNRIVTGLCLLVAGVGMLAAIVRVPYRRDLTRLGGLVIVGLLGNAVLGGLTVLFKLRPELITAHFVLAIGVLTAAVVLVHRAAERHASAVHGRDRRAVLDAHNAQLARILCVLGGVVLFLGTMVTGAGPHGGDPNVTRYGFTMLAAVRAHGAAAWLFLVCVLLLALRVSRTPGAAPRRVRQRLTVLIGIGAAQGAVGYFQWFNRVPAGLVMVHIVGAVALWTTLLWVRATIWLPPEHSLVEVVEIPERVSVPSTH